MARRVQIRVDVANALMYLGQLYRNPSEAIKEYVSNALDEWRKGDRGSPCRVRYLLAKMDITISYNAPGMTEKEFEAALQRVADSAKRHLDVAQIGQLGIGVFAFNQIGSSAVFYSKKAPGEPTVKVTLRRESAEAEFDTAPKHEALNEPGMRVVIRGLLHDPTRPRGPLSPAGLRKFFGEKFDSDLRQGNLEITIDANGKLYQVKPAPIMLPQIGKALQELPARGDVRRTIRTQLWFDSMGKGTVSIRHSGVGIVNDLKGLQAYGLEEGAWASGYVHGYIDADFLRPLPARGGFEENTDWVEFIETLLEAEPTLAEEVERQRSEAQQVKLTELQRQAIRLASEILYSDQFQDLELLGGMRRERGPVVQTGEKRGQKPAPPAGARSQDAGDKRSPGGLRVNYEETPFPEGPNLHSAFVAGTIRANTLHPDYRREMLGPGPDTQKLAYATLLIGKEAVAFNDKSGAVNQFLERMLSFLFEVKSRTGAAVTTPRGRPGHPRRL
ncbi:MAG: ATP-binding protein [Chloroflexi bacterium]|nr:ATP-binding protein [Chloroflexota bacterium]